MNKFTKLILASAVAATSGFTATIEGTENIAEGGLYEIKDNDCTLTGTMILAGSETDGNAAKLIIDADRTLDVQGGTLKYEGSETYRPQITLNGTLKLSPNEEESLPTVHLENVEVTSTITETALKVGDAIYQIISQTNNGPVIEYETDEGLFMAYNGKIYQPTSGSIGGGSFSTITGTDPRIEAWEMLGYLRKDGQLYRTYHDHETVELYRGEIDMSSLRTYSETATDTLDLSTNISGIAPTALGTAKLPFNCQFSNVDLSNVNSVEYTKLTIKESSGPGIEGGVIKKVITQAAATYGDYKNDASLGVTTTANGTEQTIEGTKTDLDFATLAGDSDTYNKKGLKLLTDDLNVANHLIEADTTYNFGFIGSTAISVTGEHKAKFMGDSAEYNPTDDSLTLPTEVKFGGDKSLFPITQTYGHGTFSGSYTNEIPEGKTVTFSNGFSLETGHTIIVKGKLVI